MERIDDSQPETCCCLRSSPISFSSSPFSFSRLSIRCERGSICSAAPALSSSMILMTRQRRNMTTMEPISSRVPRKRTSIMRPAMMTMASMQWKADLKNERPNDQMLATSSSINRHEKTWLPVSFPTQDVSLFQVHQNTYQAHNTQCFSRLGSFTFWYMSLTRQGGDDQVGKDAADIKRDEQEHCIVASLGSQETSRLPPR